ncbi:EmrB/QacA subfamily drug resistance transporter [Bradyrhizobium sp. JR7.2]|uniref:MFS transporter n=1 Tax=unclassified Bradyrhizobium TaxID=2631580 RepID=UPI0033975254
MLDKPQQNDDETRSASWRADDGHRGNRMSLETATLLAACLSGFLFQVDLTALAAALPDIGRDLGAASARAAWAIDVYSLALIFCLPIAGSLADRYGRVQMFTWGAGLFGLASLLCACATTFDVLLTFRTLQGIAGACITSTSSALLAGAYEGPRRARAFGLWGTIVGASMVAGPPLGSLLADTIGWRWIFWVNLPLCALLVVLVLCRIGNGLDQQRSSAKVDWLGAGLLAITSATLAFMLLEAPALGGIASATFLAGLAASGIALLLFVWVERRHPNPAFDLKLFGSRQFIAMCLVPIAGSTGFWSLVYVPQLARGPLGLSPLGAGWLLVALTLPMMVLPRYGAALTTRIPSRSFFCGGLALIGVADLALGAISGAHAGPGTLAMTVIALLVSGSGCAVINAQITAAAVSAVPGDRAATASAICVTMRQIGFSFGIALLGAALQLSPNGDYLAAFIVAGASTLALTAIVYWLMDGKQAA